MRRTVFIVFSLEMDPVMPSTLYQPQSSRISINNPVPSSPTSRLSLSCEHTECARIRQLQAQVEALTIESRKQQSQHHYAMAHSSEQLRVACTQLRATERRAQEAEARLTRIQDNTLLLRDISRRLRQFESTVFPLRVDPRTRFTIFEIRDDAEGEYLDPGAFEEGSNIDESEYPRS